MIIAFGILGTEIFRWEFHRDEPVSADPRLIYDFEEVVGDWDAE